VTRATARRFRATVEPAGRGGHLVALPFAADEAFGRVRAPVQVTVNGHAFRTTTMRYGGVDYVGLNRQVRDAARIAAGDVLTFRVALDTAPRTVDVPAELQSALAGDTASAAAYEELSFTHRTEYARWVGEARRPETRERRAAKAVGLLRAGARTPG
jgi:hypothetical protein